MPFRESALSDKERAAAPTVGELSFEACEQLCAPIIRDARPSMGSCVYAGMIGCERVTTLSPAEPPPVSRGEAAGDAQGSTQKEEQDAARKRAAEERARRASMSGAVMSVAVDSGVICRVNIGCPGGRRPEGYEDAGAAGPSEEGRWLGRCAALEAASVGAFRRLAAELSAHGAPAKLVRAALASARDETRHAALTARLARRFGGRAPQAPAPPPRGVRRLVDVAVENAVEGCVNEAYGAASAAVQALCAGDAAAREVFGAVARDEARHAELAGAVHRWAMRRLSREERLAVREARARAVEALMAQVQAPVPTSMTAALGVPPAEVAQALAASLAGSLWADPLS